MASSGVLLIFGGEAKEKEITQESTTVQEKQEKVGSQKPEEKSFTKEAMINYFEYD